MSELKSENEDIATRICNQSNTGRLRCLQWVSAAGLIVAVVVSYLPAMDGGFVWDDNSYVIQDDRLETLAGLGRIWTQVVGDEYLHQFYPMTTTGFWVQHKLWGKNATGYHVVNVLLHAANALLLWRLLQMLQLPGAWFCAAIFAVHPVQVMSVAWISELKNVLSMLFYLSSLLALVRFLGLDSPKLLHRDHGRLQWGWYVLGLGLFFCALLSKTATGMLPVAVLLLLWWKCDRLSGRDLVGLVPFAVLAIVFVCSTVLIELKYGTANKAAYDHTVVEKFLIAGRAMWFYVGKLVWPDALTVIYPRWQIDSSALSQYVAPIGVLLVISLLWVLRRRIGKGPLVAVGFFIVAVAPVSFVQVGFMRLSYVSDHWQYWSSIGLITLAVSIATVLPRCGGMERWISWLAVGIVLVSFSRLTYQQSKIYESPQVFWSDTIKKNPGADVAYNNLGMALESQGLFAEATKHFYHAVELKPDDVQLNNHLANVLVKQGRWQEARRYFDVALKINPNDADTYYNIGVLLTAQGRLHEAIRFYSRSIELDPNPVDALNNLGNLLASAGEPGTAIEQFRRALKINPNDIRINFNLGITLAEQGHFDQAIHYFRRSLEIDPGLTEAQSYLDRALRELDQ